MCLLLRERVMIYSAALGYIVVKTAVSYPKVTLGHLSHNDHP
jgi:hypothetical protein